MKIDEINYAISVIRRGFEGHGFDQSDKAAIQEILQLCGSTILAIHRIADALEKMTQPIERIASPPDPLLGNITG